MTAGVVHFFTDRSGLGHVIDGWVAGHAGFVVVAVLAVGCARLVWLELRGR